MNDNTGHRAEWMSLGTFGLMVHYLVSPEGDSPAARSASHNRIVAGFGVAPFVEAVLSTGADWLIFTLGQNTCYYNSPNRYLDARLPGHTCQRDLFLEIADGLKAQGRRTIAYLPAEVCGAKELHDVFGWSPCDPSQRTFQPRYQEFIRAWAVQFGDRCDGWWFDGCYEWDVFPNRLMDFAGYIAAARAGNERAVTAFNDGAFCVGKVAPVTPLEDYHPGEIHTLADGRIALGWWQRDPVPYLPADRFVDGVQWHGLLPVDSTFAGPDLPDQHYDDQTLVRLLEAVRGVGGALTFNLPVGVDGRIPPATLAQMQRVGRAIG
jgi:hypothetical protein